MNGMIIDPKYIYLIETVGSFKGFALGASVFFGVIAVIASGIMLYGLDCDRGIVPNARKAAIITVIIAFIFALLAMSVPSRVAMLEITIARYATYENASATIEQIKGVADYVIDAISKLK